MKVLQPLSAVGPQQLLQCCGSWRRPSALLWTAISSPLMQPSPARPRRHPLRAPGRLLQQQASRQVSFLCGAIQHHTVQHGIANLVQDTVGS